VKYREQKDWASYTLTRKLAQAIQLLMAIAQWQAWLRHSRENVPSLKELQVDEERQVRTRLLAKIADQRWITQGQQSIERLAVGSSEEALKGTEQLTLRC
jgi:flagellar motility protein MotE (MotC chaperone)